jgi:hypothetical protein
MIGHQTIPMHPQPKPHRLLSQQPKVHPSIVVNKKHILVVITSLGNMMNDPRQHYPTNSRHTGSLPKSYPIINPK